MKGEQEKKNDWEQKNRQAPRCRKVIKPWPAESNPARESMFLVVNHARTRPPFAKKTSRPAAHHSDRLKTAIPFVIPFIRFLWPALSLLLLLWPLPGNGQPAVPPVTDWDRCLAERGLADVSRLDTTLQVKLIYAVSDNFLGEPVYAGITKAWLRPEAARMLASAQQILRKKHPGWSLLVYDAARPMSVQRKMWRLVSGTDKTNYVSNPANGGGLHNYGMAVDVGLLDSEGNPLPMGTPVDFFGEEAHTTAEETLVKTGRIRREELGNRLLLRQVMKQAGFRTIPYEWWHFNACTRAYARTHYPVIE